MTNHHFLFQPWRMYFDCFLCVVSVVTAHKLNTASFSPFTRVSRSYYKADIFVVCLHWWLLYMSCILYIIYAYIVIWSQLTSSVAFILSLALTIGVGCLVPWDIFGYANDPLYPVYSSHGLYERKFERKRQVFQLLWESYCIYHPQGFLHWGDRTGSHQLKD